MGLVCKRCGTAYGVGEKVWRCRCGGLLDLKFVPSFPKRAIRARAPSMWRYREALPILWDGNITSFGEGFTPLVQILIEGRTVLIKQDHLFPTGSYKDRGASVLVSKVRELGIAKVVEDSSGNAGSAIAAYCASAGIGCDIYVPADTSEGKLAQISLFGARLHRVPGSREDTARAVLGAAESDYYASHSWNPFFFHGTKTFAFEVAEQLGWKAPDAVVLPVGNGTLLLGAWLGFQELFTAGVTRTMPRVVGVQSANCAPLYKAFARGAGAIPRIDKRDTIAEGIAIAEPVRGEEIVAAVRNSGGFFITVSEREIGEALIQAGRKGFCIEPTAAATLAGLKKYAKRAGKEQIVSAFTGNGLKATDKLLKLAGNASGATR